ncbi:MAG TPA: CoA-binding protein [Candidatus Eisenbacteria bacterium]
MTAPGPIEIEDEETLAAIVRSMRTVAVVGMVDERKADRPAHAIPRLLLARGLRVVPVNPRIERALGEKAYPDLASVPVPFDAVDVFRRSEDVWSHAEEVLALPADRRPSVFWMQSGIRNERAAAALTAAGVRVVMDRCLGVYAARYRTPAAP